MAARKAMAVVSEPANTLDEQCVTRSCMDIFKGLVDGMDIQRESMSFPVLLSETLRSLVVVYEVRELMALSVKFRVLFMVSTCWLMLEASQCHGTMGKRMADRKYIC